MMLTIMNATILVCAAIVHPPLHLPVKKALLPYDWSLIPRLPDIVVHGPNVDSGYYEQDTEVCSS